MIEPIDYESKQLQPLGLFDLSSKWIDALKVIGAANGAGFVAAGAALSTFIQQRHSLFWVKAGGVCFLIGIVTFSIAFMLIHVAIFSYDEMAHAFRRKDAVNAQEEAEKSGSTMKAANKFAIISSAFFFLGLVAALIAFLNLAASPPSSCVT